MSEYQHGTISWKRLDAGEYESADKRFYILQSYDRLYGNHWVLHDKNITDYYKQQYHDNSLRECKARAEALALKGGEVK